MKAMLNPSLELLGAVGVITDADILRRRERSAAAVALRQMKDSWGGKPIVFDRHIPRRAAIQHAAGESVAYLKDADIQNLFDRLGREITGAMGWEKGGNPNEREPIAKRSA